MMAGAPGASGSLVIFDSSGDTGWKPPPAFTVAGWYVATPSSITIANDEGANRRPIDIAQLALGISLQSRPDPSAGEENNGQRRTTQPDTHCAANPRPGSETVQWHGYRVKRISDSMLSHEGPVSAHPRWRDTLFYPSGKRRAKNANLEIPQG